MENNQPRIPKNSKLPIISAICAGLMIFFSFCDISLFSDELDLNFIVPSFGSLIVPVVFFIFIILFAKKNIGLMIIPLYLSMFVSFMFIYFDLILYDFDNFIFSLSNNLFELFIYALLLIIFTLTITNVIKSKIPLIVSCLLGVVLAIILTLLYKSPFAYGIYYVSISSLFKFSAYCTGIAVLGFALESDFSFEYYDNKSSNPSINPVTTPPELLEVKSIGMCILLSLITCGIYQYFWLYTICNKIKLLNNDYSSCVGEFLCIFFIPFYFFYWIYSRTQKISSGAAIRNISVKDNSALYLLISLFITLMSIVMMQNDLNNIALELNLANKQNP